MLVYLLMKIKILACWEFRLLFEYIKSLNICSCFCSCASLQCIQSCMIKLRVKRRSDSRLGESSFFNEFHDLIVIFTNVKIHFSNLVRA